MSDDMRGLFFIVKGQYRKSVGTSFVNKVSGDVSYTGGYDPERGDTDEWYMLLDSKTYHCIACGSDFNKVLGGVRTVIKRHKGVARNYFKHVSSITSDDYYETHYLGRPPLTHDQRVKKAEGRCPRVSPIMRDLYDHIYSEFGHYYSDEVSEMEDLAYSDLVEDRPYNKARRIMSKTKTPKKTIKMTKKEEETPEKSVETLEKPVVKKIKKTKTKIGIKKLSTVC